MTGNLWLKGSSIFMGPVSGAGRFYIQFLDGHVYLVFYDTDSNERRTFDLRTKNTQTDKMRAISFQETTNGSTASYNIFGEHNKPSGTYTGNGSAASRTINIGGIGGKILFITGNGYSFIVTPNGAFGCHLSSGALYLKQSEVQFNNGELTLATASTYVNANAATYNYYVL